MEDSRDMQQQSIERLLETIDDQKKTIDSQKKAIDHLKETVARLQGMLYGSKSEKVVYDPSQLLPGMQEFFAAPPAEKAAAEGKEEQVKDYTRRRGGQPKAGWNGFPESLEREEKVIELPEEERRGMELVGYDVSERLIHRSAYLVQVLKRAKYARKDAPAAGVLTAPAPRVPSCLSMDSDRCHYDVSAVVHVLAEKLVDHLPFYRQSAMFARLGIQFGRSAMCDYFAKVSAALRPLYLAMAEEILACPVLHADETHVRMQEPGTGKTRTCWIWVRRSGVGPPLTVFHFSTDRKKDTAAGILGDYRGTVIRDQYSAYADLSAKAAGCWAHCRRKFFHAKGNHPDYANRALDLVRELYRNEDLARDNVREEGSEEELFRLRRIHRGKSRAVAERYFTLCREIVRSQPPGSSIAAAAAYSLNAEGSLRQFLDDPMVNIDNNPCENVIRPFCLGRKNWLFVGNAGGGASMATLASFAATCKENGVDFEKWLCDILPRLDDCPAARVADLLPHRWRPAD